MAFKKGGHKRRSDRLMLRVPLRVEGLTKIGEKFECEGQAVTISRYGAHIRLERPVPVSEKLFVTNLRNSLRGEFRIVSVLEGTSGGKTDFGIEALGNYPTFWGIEFPPRPADPGECRGLLECQRCLTATLHPLLLDEIEELESGGVVRKHCATCGSRTQWKFTMGSSKASLLFAEEPPEAAFEKAQGSTTVIIRRPVSIRTSGGRVEVVQTENLSNDEIRCTSEKGYEVNQLVTLEWENSGTGQRLKVQGRVRRRQSIAGSRRVVYSIRYEGSPVVLPPVPLKPVRNLYVATGVLMVAAAVLLEICVVGLISSLEFPSHNTASRVAGLGVVVLLLGLAHKIWGIIRAREPERRRLFKKRHLTAASLAAAVFLGSLGVGAIDGMGRNNQRQQALEVLSTSAVAHIFEQNIDAAENRVANSPADYTDISKTLGLLAGQWQTQLDALSSDTSRLRNTGLWHNARFEHAMNGLQQVLVLDRRKLRLVRQQAALATAARNLDPNRQETFWQSRFPPLHQQILNLDAQRNHLTKSLMAGE